MDYDGINCTGDNLILVNMRHFDLARTLDCGQCFRWKENGDGIWQGIVHGQTLRLSMDGGNLILYDTSPDAWERIWKPYFDLERDYGELFTRFAEDAVLRKAMAFAPGIRVLRQPPFEALCSFILSQNNNIIRIKGLVDRLCTCFGTPLEDGGFGFPHPEDLARLTPDDLSPVRAGFRARYLIDAAQKVHSGQIDLDSLYTLPLEEARETLTAITGVGPKVANCVLLYGFARADCIPVDVWISRAMKHLYPSGFPEALKPWGGIAQQTLFHYARCCPEALPPEAFA